MPIDRYITDGNGREWRVRVRRVHAAASLTFLVFFSARRAHLGGWLSRIFPRRERVTRVSVGRGPGWMTDAELLALLDDRSACRDEAAPVRLPASFRFGAMREPGEQTARRASAERSA